jgi:hypothetical protein
MIGVPRERCKGIATDINPLNGGFSILITNKLSAFGASVVVAFAAVLVLLVASPLTASANKGITAGGAITIANIATGTDRDITVSSTHISGTEACTEGVFTLVANKTVGGTATIADAACTVRSTTVSIAPTTTATTLTVASTTGFPDAGSIHVGAAAMGTVAALEEIMDYTSKTATSFDGLTRKRAGTPAVAHAIAQVVYPVNYSTIVIAPSAADGVTVNLADATGWVAGTGPELIFAPGKATNAQAPEVTTAKSGNTFTHVATGIVFPLGTYVAQVSAVNTDKATVTFTRTASTTTTGEFQFISTAGGEASSAGTQSITLITDKPDANASAATVSATEPVAIPVLVSLTGSDLTEDADTASFALTTLPTKGILGAVGAAVCTDVAKAKVGAVMTNCTAMVTYTPLLGATGSDTFNFTFTNGAEVSVAAAGSITLPAAPVVVAAPTLTGGFAATLSTGVNLTTYGGGTVAELDADGVAAGATSISVTIDGAFVVYVVSAPEFVNAAFNAQYPTSVASGTVVLVVK